MEDSAPELLPPWPKLSGYACAQMATTARICFWTWLLCALQVRVDTKHGPLNLGLVVATPLAFWACCRLVKTNAIFGYRSSVFVLFICWPFADAMLLFLKLLGPIQSSLWALVGLFAIGGTFFALVGIFRAWGRGFFDLALSFRN